MRILDSKWSDFAAGYQAVRSLQSRLESEFGRAVQVGHKQKFRRELTEWQKKRRVFFSLVAAAPLSVITLCVLAFYLRDVACVLIYWVVVVLVILAALAVAGRSYIREAVNRPVPGQVPVRVVDLEQRWWESLAPKELALKKATGKDEVDFLTLLGRSLPDDYVGVRRPSGAAGDPAEAEVVLVGPSGVWAFAVRPWGGTITKQDGSWRQVQTVRGKLGRKTNVEKVHAQAPDDQWVRLKTEIVTAIRTRLPQLAWTADLLQGGVVFSHPKARPDKEGIKGHTAPYGPAGPWAERVRTGQAQDGFTPEVRLQVLGEWLDSIDPGDDRRSEAVSARAEAERLYQEAAQELRQDVAQMMK